MPYNNSIDALMRMFAKPPQQEIYGGGRGGPMGYSAGGTANPPWGGATPSYSGGREQPQRANYTGPMGAGQTEYDPFEFLRGQNMGDSYNGVANVKRPPRRPWFGQDQGGIQPGGYEGQNWGQFNRGGMGGMFGRNGGR